ncbi:hypothetical protein DYBT9275_04959 [Dyadobacter sp. CECT 9275]|uniref:Uncharacterized protein n=1 Tax=Dyadobacter helix TaxID=2822344 RepID=A0A916JFD1_9BACT|nr:hypothetical protein [Dyadobacter sp. CECT 9275]CAG5011483.1 hypothetical protein DYBT9275_04959 [Dyadobacter sp. CECT 9275]
MSKYASIIAGIALILIFIFTLFTQTLNAPSFDDFEATLAIIKRFYFENRTWKDRLAVLFLRHNEHRIVISRSVAVLYYHLFGNISFSNLVWFQNVFLLGFFGLILKIFADENKLSASAFLIITSFLFSFSFWQVSFYYWAGIQHFTVFFFSFLSLILLNEAVKLSSWRFILSVISATLAAFSFGNGFLVLLLGGFILLVQRKYALLAVWAVLSGIMLYITFLVDPNEPNEKETFSLVSMAKLLFTFMGSYLFINPPSDFLVYLNIIFCMIAGLAILIFWVWLFISGYACKKPLLYSLFSLPVLTGILISISRFSTKAAGGIAPRYMFFTSLIPVLLLLILLDIKVIKREWLGWFSVLVVVLWSAGFYFQRKELILMNTEITTNLNAWKQDHSHKMIFYRDAEPYSSILQWSIENKVFQLQDQPGPSPVPVKN